MKEADVAIEYCGRGVIGIVFVILVSVGFSSAETGRNPEQKSSDRRIEWGIRVQDYKWAEYTETGNKLLEETGCLYAIACNFEDLGTYVGWRNNVNLFFGQVDYNGQTWSGTPAKSDVLYAGMDMSVDAVPSYRFESGLLLKGFAGIGGRWWFRDIDNTQTDAGDPVQGAEEWWWLVCGRLGGGIEYPVMNGLDMFSEAGMQIPIYARNEANLYIAGAPSASLEPEQYVSVFGNIGVRWKKLAVKFIYDSLRFNRSDKVSSGTLELYQPRSKADIFSMEVCWTTQF